MKLRDYKGIVGAAAGFSTILQMFSGIFLCRDIYKNGSTKNFSPVPFIGGSVLSSLFCVHALMLREFAMIFTNLVGLALNIGYLLFFYLWTLEGDRQRFHKDFLKGIGLVLVLMVYCTIENEKVVEYRFGLILTFFLLYLIASPLFSLGEIIRTKSTGTLSYPMILSGIVVSSLWLLYGFIIENNVIIIQNAIGSILTFIQLCLFFIYPRNAKKKRHDFKKI